MTWWRAFWPTAPEALQRLPPIAWRRGRLRRADRLLLVVPGVAAAILMPDLALPWLATAVLLPVVAAAKGRRDGAHDLIQLASSADDQRRLFVLDRQGYRPVRLAWLDNRRIVLRRPHRIIYRDEVSPLDFARLRRWALGVYPQLGGRGAMHASARDAMTMGSSKRGR